MYLSFMYYCLMYSKEIIKGTLRPIILKLLKEHDRLYGYEITQAVKRITSDKIQITEGALYPLLHKLEAEGAVSIEIENIGKRVRKYYRLTEQGETLSQQLIDEFVDFMATMQQIFQPNPANGLT